MNKIIVLLSILGLFVVEANPAYSQPAIKFISPNGTLSFTDSPKQVPAAATNVLSFDLKDLKDRTTRVEAQPVRKSPYPQFLLFDQPRPADTVTGPTYVRRVRVQEGQFNRQVWQMVYPDGTVAGEVPSSPIGVISR